MRRIGVLGGMSWESTAEYYRLLNEIAAKQLGGLHSADLLVRSVDFAEVEEMQVAGEWDRAGERLAEEAATLSDAGAEVIVLATNTMHKVAGTLEETYGDRFLHLGDTTAAAVRTAGVQKVGLLGTGFTMSQPFYADRLRSHGLEVTVPNETDQQRVHRIIYEELCLGVFEKSSRQAYLEVIDRLVAEGCEGVILGCTEIELLLPMESYAGVRLFPTTRLHCEAAIEAALSA
ncbi:aspartate racemase [Nocardioides luteus]|uniref:Aspartate racemase n=1 Tax=Nocardioides luteus TaxID=1844 RepID=A0ABQ5SR90_9ACTN|nr:aspartate/glutamate racemase family protein [Nocardioides luteus]MDR7311121.1 aspartate racemase [Nocardioides luteus]GGR62428.1 aspartate racemase [Nocardioides luteus]GLJ66667.1 aspartate racemase [Nocardioides luteus]